MIGEYRPIRAQTSSQRFSNESEDHQNAILLYDKAVELNPQWFPTYYDLAYSTKNVKGPEAAVALLQRFVERYPDAPGVPYARQTIKEIEG